mgnify:CR=1 FL=1
MTQVHWVIDGLLMERYEGMGGPTLAEAVASCGHVAHNVRYRPIAQTFDPEPRLPSEAPVVFYGTLEGLRCIRRVAAASRYGWQPLAFCREETLSYAGFVSSLSSGGVPVLNDDFVLLPVGEIRRRCAMNARAFLSPFGGTAFIRPNKVTKTFGARVLTPGNAAFELEAMNAVEIVADDEIAVVASVKDVGAEYRFVIANGKVVAGSQYQTNGELDICPDVAMHARSVANHVARLPWQADTVYVCDVGTHHAEAKVVELNSFSCAGLYACDTVSIVEAVSAAAIREFEGSD